MGGTTADTLRLSDLVAFPGGNTQAKRAEQSSHDGNRVAKSEHSFAPIRLPAQASN